VEEVRVEEFEVARVSAVLVDPRIDTFASSQSTLRMGCGWATFDCMEPALVNKLACPESTPQGSDREEPMTQRSICLSELAGDVARAQCDVPRVMGENLRPGVAEKCLAQSTVFLRGSARDGDGSGKVSI